MIIPTEANVRYLATIVLQEDPPFPGSIAPPETELLEGLEQFYRDYYPQFKSDWEEFVLRSDRERLTAWVKVNGNKVVQETLEIPTNGVKPENLDKHRKACVRRWAENKAFSFGFKPNNA